MKKINFSLCLVQIILIFNFSSLQGQNCTNQVEFDALMALYDATDGANWTDNSGWGVDCDLSTWFGVNTNGSGKVTKIDLRENGLNGSLPDNWDTYTVLHTIHLQDNALDNTIPPSLGSAPALKRLYMQNNLFSGNIPENLGNNPLLERLNLSNNSTLGGGIPSTFQNLTNLQRLHLQNNSHSDTIPFALTQLADLERVYLQNNQFSGSIPTGLGNLQNLTHLYLQNNNLTGCIPEEFSSLCGADVRLQNNECLSHENGDFSLFCLDSSCETVPNCVCPKPVDYDALMELYLATNGDQWLNNSNWGQNCDLSTWHGITTNGIDEVTKIDLRENGLTGTLPDNWDSYPALKTLFLMNNDLGGNVPSSLGGSNSITIINLKDNSLFGVLPPELGDISQLEQLILSNNDSLSGTIPENFSNLSKLRFLYLQNNNHTGEIPASLGTIDSLERLLLQNNALTGSIPPSFGSLPKLERLYLQNNDFEGCIPSTFTNLCALDIRLQNNDCLSHEQGDFALFCLDPTCQIIEGCPCPQPADYMGLVAIYDSLDGPNWINQEGWKMDCDICSWYGISCDGSGRVTKIDLRENNLGGSLPTDIGSFEYLRSLYLQKNAISNSIPASIGDLENLIRLHLSSNNFSGDIPSTIVNLSNLENLYLQDNLFTGSIPSNLDQLPNLNNLYLHTNQFTGDIPISLGTITTLRRLSLHHNNLSGTIPTELSNLLNLEYLFLNNNQLIDSIPIGLGSLNNLKYLYLSNNELDGPIPTSFGSLDSLQRLRLSHNSLTGEIPVELTSLDQLQHLFLNHNELTGIIPEGFSSAQLSRIYFQNNSLSGEIPEDFANLEVIEYLYLSNNQFTGELPPGIADGGLLRRILIQNNTFGGELPPELGTLDSLTHLFVQNNDFTGCIPPSYTNLCEININLTGNGCLSHSSGDMTSFCNGMSCEASNIDCELCSDGIQNNGESQIDCGGVCDICRPDLDISSLAFPDSNYIPGTQINASIELGNIGQVNVTDTFLLMYFISEDSVLDSSTDILIDAAENFGLDAGAIDTVVRELLIPHDIAGGSYYLIAVADLDQEVSLETNFTNNSTFDQLTILDPSCTDGVLNGSEEDVDCGGDECDVCPTCDDGILNQEEVGVDCGGPNCPGCPTDLVALTFNAPAQITKTIIASFNASWGIEKASVPGNYYLGVYLSQDSILDNSEDVRIYFRNTFAARGKGKVVSFSGTNTLLVSDTIPAGDYFLIFNIEEGDLYDEYNEDNNTLSRPVSILERETCTDGILNQDEEDVDCGGVCEVCRPDLGMTNLSFTDMDYIPGTQINVTTGINNIGQADVTDTFQLQYYISTDTIFDVNTDILIDSTEYFVVDVDVEIVTVNDAIIPNDIAGGEYYLIVVADPDHAVSLETNLSNNAIHEPLNILAPSCTDGILNGTEEDVDCGGNCTPCPVFDIALEQIVFEAGTSEFVIGETIDISPGYTILNLPNQVDIFSRVVISTDTIISEDDVELGIFIDEYISDGFYMQNYPVVIPTSISAGTYNIIVRTNNSEFPSEDDYSNNLGTSEITLSLPNPCDTGGEGEEEEGSGGCEECPEFIDLAMTYIVIDVEQQTSGGYLNVTTNTQNVGTLTSDAGVSIEYYLSSDDSFDPGVDPLLGNAQLISLEGCQIDETVTNVLIPLGTASGEYTLFVRNTLDDANSENDFISGAISIVPAGCMDGIQNQDETDIDCGGVCPPCVEICDNNIDDDGDGLIDCLDGDCGGDVACPTCTDGIMNGNETGVDCGGPDCAPCVLLDIIGINMTPWTGNFSQYPGLDEAFYVNYEIIDGDATTFMNIEVFLSLDSILDESSDLFLESVFANQNIAGTYQQSIGISIPVNTAPGDYYLITKIDSKEVIPEADETNNILFTEYTVLPATCDDEIQNQGETAIDCGGPFCPACPLIDIAGIDLTPWTGNFSQYPGLDEAFYANYEILNTNFSSFMKIEVYLSADSTLEEGSDTFLESVFANQNIVGFYQQSIGIDIPINTVPGDYYLIVKLDGKEVVPEEDETNNIIFIEYTVLTATCDDGIQNQGETDVDCGGPLCQVCPTIDIVGIDLTPWTGNFAQYPGLDESFYVNYEILNTNASTFMEIEVYLSLDNILDESADVLLESAFANQNDVGIYQRSMGITIPANTVHGDYYLIAKIDGKEVIPEVDESNNVIFVPYEVLETPDIQLTIDNIANMTSPGEIMPYGVTITNNSGQEITDAFKMTVYLSEDASLSASIDSIIHTFDFNGISADSSFQLFENLTIPEYALAGDYYLIFWVDSEEQIAEYGLESNNIANTFITIDAATCSDGIQNQDETEIDCGGSCPSCETCFDGIQNQDEEGVDCGGVCTECIKPDLDITLVEGVTSTFGGRSFNMWVNYNVTDFPVSGGVRIGAYFSQDNILDKSIDVQIVNDTGNPGSINNHRIVVLSVGIPDDIAPGEYTIIAEIDPLNEVDELDEGNNLYLLPVTILEETCTDGALNQDEEGIDCGGVCPPCLLPDAFITFTEGVTSTYGGRSFNLWVNYTIVNAPLPDGVTITAYLSDDNQYDEGVDTFMKTSNQSGGQGNRRIVMTGTPIPDVAPGDYYIMVVIDPRNGASEEDSTNNTYAMPVTILEETCTDGVLNQDEEGIDCGGVCAPCALPDADITLVQGVTSTYGPRTFNLWVNYTIANATIPGGVRISAYLSDDNKYDEGVDQLMKTSIQSGGQGNRRIVMTGTPIPDALPGSYYMVVVIDPLDVVDEEDETNNEYANPLTIIGYEDVEITMADLNMDTLSSGAQIIYDVQIQSNAQKDITKTSSLGVYLSQDASYDAGVDILLDQIAIDSFVLGEIKDIQGEFTFTETSPPGPFYLIFWADNLGQLVEGVDEDNNFYNVLIDVLDPTCSDGVQNQDETDVDCGGSCVECPKYDLSITSLSMYPTTIATGGEAFINLKVENISTVDAMETMMVDYYVSENETFDTFDVQVAVDSFDFIPAGEARTLKSFAVITEAIPVGAMNLIAKVNSLGSMEELDPFNNNGMITFTILPNTCNDGVRNGDEEGVDCGGSCPDACSTCPYPQEEVDALMALYDSLGGDNWTNNNGWGEDCNICLWDGIQCQPDGFYSIFLRNNGLNGTLPPEIGKLQNLDFFYLKTKQGGSNNIYGLIPPEIGNLPNVRQIQIQHSNLTGSIPIEITNLPRLHGLALNNNNLTGRIPSDMGNMASINWLRLENNQLEGCIPSSLSSLCGKAVFKLHDNPDLLPNAGDVSAFCYGGFECAPAIGERNTALISSDWSVIDLDLTYIDPVIVAGPLSNGELDASTIRIRNVKAESFEMRIEEWDCAPGDHALEVVSYVVFEAGSYELENGSKLTAINTQISQSSETLIAAPFEYNVDYNILSQVVSANEEEAVSIQTNFVSGANPHYELTLQEAKLADDIHQYENVSVIVAETEVNDDGLIFEIGNSVALGDATSTIDFEQTYGNPIMIGKLSSANESEPSALRYTSINSGGADVNIDEDDSCGSGSGTHGAEDVHYMVFDGPGLITGTLDQADLTFADYQVVGESFTSGDFIPVQFDISNIGTLTASASSVELYFSTDTQFSDDDVEVSLKRLPFLASGQSTGQIDVDVYIPYYFDGTYYLIGQADSDYDVDESNEENNIVLSQELSIAIALCSNGILDTGEIQIDCGGTCPNACPEILEFDEACADQFTEVDFSRPIDTDLEVGSMAGYPSVSPSGSALYSIPFALPPGTRGVAPSVGLMYNSQGRNGIAGQGWSLTGISSITRTNKSIYYDGFVGPIQLLNSDVISLDGSRLMVKNGFDYGDAAAEYGAESEDFSTIYPKDVTAQGASWYEVKTKSGMILEFGRTEDSKFLTTNDSIAVFWNVNKAIDSYGNYIEYKYQRVGDELLIDEILYTGNSNVNLAPYNSIKFIYDERGDKNISYIVGQALEMNHLLSKVEIHADTQHVRSYELCYAHGPITSGLDPIRTYLQEVQEVGSGEVTRLNTTRFRYGDKTPSSDVIDVKRTTGSRLLKENFEDYVRIGDFNGDGLDDIAVFRAEEQDGIDIAKSVEIYTKESVHTDEFIYKGSAPLEEYLDLVGKKSNWLSRIVDFIVSIGVDKLIAIVTQTWWLQIIISVAVGFLYSPLIIAFLGADVNAGNFTFQVSDLNGDHREEVVLYTPDFDSKSGEEKIFTIGLGALDDIVVEEYLFARNKDHEVVDFNLGDYDGDSKLDFLIVLGDSDTDDRDITDVMVGLSSSLYAFQSVQISPDVAILPSDLTGARWISGNFDGDVKTDLLVVGGVNVSGSKVLTLEIDQSGVTLSGILGKPVQQLPYPTLLHHVQVSDFNGDGRADIISGSWRGNWEVAYFDGLDFHRFGFDFGDLPRPRLYYDDDKKYLRLRDRQVLTIADFNADGKMDVFYAPTVNDYCWERFDDKFCFTEDQYPLNIYYSAGFSFIREEVPNKFEDFFHTARGYSVQDFDLGDFNGDGITDLLSTRTGFQIMYVNEFTEELLLKDILDGFNNLVSFNYATMADTAVYQRTENPIVNSYSHPIATSISPASYPINKMTFTSRIVQELKTPDGLSTGQNTLSYSYEDAIYHREGKGFLGFIETTTEDLHQDRRSISKVGMNKTFFSTFPIESRIEIASTDEVIAKSNADVTFVDQGNKRYWLRTDNTFDADIVHQRGQDVNYVYDNAAGFGNLQSEWTVIKGLNGQTLESTQVFYGNYSANGSYIPFQTQSINVISKRLTEPNFSVTTSYDYDVKGTLKERKDFVGLTQEVKSTFSVIDSFGNPTLFNVIAINQDVADRSYSIDYDSTGRFVETAMNALNQPSYAKYDPRWGVPLTVTTVDSNITSITYDEFGRQEDISVPAGYTFNMDYKWDVRSGTGLDINDASDAVFYAETTHPAAPDTKMWYTSLGKIRKTTFQDFKYGDGEFHETSEVQTYDLRGRMHKATDPFRSGSAPLIYTYEYDSYNRPDSIVSPTGQSTFGYATFTNGDLEVTHTSEDNLVEKITTDATGKSIISDDTGNGVVTYEYLSNGQPKLVKVDGVEVSKMAYDVHARQTQLWEVNSDTTNYQYNSFGEIIYQKDSRSQIGATTLVYDVLGRLDYIDQHEGHIEFSYHSSGNGLNKISEIVNYNGYTESFTYDDLDRLTNHTQLINGESFAHNYTYTPFNQLADMTCPSGLNVTYDYYSGTGFLKRLKDDQGSTIYEPLASNNYGQMTQYALGNGITTLVDYDQFGILDRIHTQGSSIFDMSFDFNISNGLLNQRTDHINGLTEDFTYDDHYRLESAAIGGQNVLNMTYDDNGNILNKSDLSNEDYLYESDKIHAVTKIPKPNDISAFEQIVAFNSAHQPSSISEGQFNLIIENGADEQRRYSLLTKDGVNQTEKYFVGSYEKEISDGVTREIHYLDAGITVVKEDEGPFEYFYTYGDYLGSVLKVTDDSGQIVAEQSFDSWGRKRNASNWTYANVDDYELPWLYRGYTGHEMLPELDLINMNGRLYDPFISRMLSVDVFAGNDGTSQSYNRYSYVYNNPLLYTDPSGECPFCGILSPEALGDIANFAATGGGLNIIITPAANKALDGLIKSAVTSGVKQFTNEYVFMDRDGNLIENPGSADVLAGEAAHDALMNRIEQPLDVGQTAFGLEQAEAMVLYGELVCDVLESTVLLQENSGMKVPKTQKQGVLPLVRKKKRGKIHSSGKKHGTTEHYAAMNKFAEKLAKNGDEVFVNKSINTALGRTIANIGKKRPDVIGVNGNTITLVEVVSPSQTFQQMLDKLGVLRKELQKQGYSVTTRVIEL